MYLICHAHKQAAANYVFQAHSIRAHRLAAVRANPANSTAPHAHPRLTATPASMGTTWTQRHQPAHNAQILVKNVEIFLHARYVQMAM